MPMGTRMQAVPAPDERAALVQPTGVSKPPSGQCWPDRAQVLLLLTDGRPERRQAGVPLCSVKLSVSTATPSGPGVISPATSYTSVQAPAPTGQAAHASGRDLASEASQRTQHPRRPPRTQPPLVRIAPALLLTTGNTNTYTFVGIESKVDV